MGLRSAVRRRAAVSAVTLGLVSGVAVAAATPAAAFAPAPVLPVSLALSAGIPSSVAGTAGAAGAVGAAPLLAPFVVGTAAVAGGALVGYGGYQAYDFVRDKWLGRVPPAADPEVDGTGTITTFVESIVIGPDAEVVPYYGAYSYTIPVVSSAATPGAQMIATLRCNGVPLRTSGGFARVYADGAFTMSGVIDPARYCGVGSPWDVTVGLTSPGLERPLEDGSVLFVPEVNWMSVKPVTVTTGPRAPGARLGDSWTIRSQGRCRFADGTMVGVSSASEIFERSAPPERTPALTCPDGSMLTSLVQSADSDTGQVVPIIKWDAPTEVQQGTGTGPGRELAGGGGAMPQLERVPGEDGAPDSCRFGSVVLAPEECAPYAPGAVPAPEPAPDPRTHPRPAPGAVPDPAPDPAPEPAPDPAPDPAPEPGPGSEPGSEPADGDCRSTLVIFAGVVCALEKAFVPSPAALGAITAAGAGLGQVTPLPQLRSAAVWVKPPALTRRCLDLNISVPDLGPRSPLPQHIGVMDTCDASNPIVKAIAPLRPLLGVVMWVVFVLPLAWWAWRQYAPGSTGTA